MRLFVEQGYAATSLTQIARAAGLSRTSLFSYFPAKRDLLWEDHDAAVGRIRGALEAARAEHVIDVLVVGMLAVATYDVADHDAFAIRWQIVHDDVELRSFAAVRSDELLKLFVDAAVQKAPGVDEVLVDSVARALMAVASHATEGWSSSTHPDQRLDEFTAARLAPLVDALRPLLP